MLTRTPAQLGDPADALTEHCGADFDDPASLARGLAGVDTLLLISSNADPACRLRQHLQVISASIRAGISRIIYTSGIGARLDSPVSLARSHAETEAALQASGIATTILRNAPYAQGLNGIIVGSLGANCVVMPAAEARISYVPRENAAAVAAGATLGTGHEHRIYEITGSHALCGFDLAALIGEVRGTTPKVFDADAWEFLQATIVPFGAPGFIIRAAEETWAAAKQGEYARVGIDAETLALGPLIQLPDYVRTIARAGMT